MKKNVNKAYSEFEKMLERIKFDAYMFGDIDLALGGESLKKRNKNRTYEVNDGSITLPEKAKEPCKVELNDDTKTEPPHVVRMTGNGKDFKIFREIFNSEMNTGRYIIETPSGQRICLSETPAWPSPDGPYEWGVPIEQYWPDDAIKDGLMYKGQKFLYENTRDLIRRLSRDNSEIPIPTWAAVGNACLISPNCAPPGAYYDYASRRFERMKFIFGKKPIDMVDDLKDKWGYYCGRDDSLDKIVEITGIEEFGQLLKWMRESVRIAQEHMQLDSDLPEGISNVDLYGDNIERLKEAMITGLTPNVQGSIQIDDIMAATTDVGRRRSNQEDAVLLAKNKIKLMAVADGMGGHSYGEVASHALIAKIKEWFEGLSDEEINDYYNDTTKIQLALDRIIHEAAKSEDFKGNGGTTLTCAVIGAHNTMIANVGDSRAYGMYKDGRLEQLTVDDSYSQWYYDEKHEKDGLTQDDMRFYTENNVISQAVSKMKPFEVNFRYFDNKDLSKICLTSDGVTDIIATKEFENLVNKYKDSNIDITKAVVEYVLTHPAIAPKKLKKFGVFFSKVDAGKDNATIAVTDVDEDKNIRKTEGEYDAR